MKIFSILLTCSFFCLSASEISNEYFDYSVKSSPEQALFLGLPTNGNLWTDYSLSSLEDKKERLRQFLSLAEQHQTTDSEEQLELDIVKWMVQDALSDLDYGSPYLLLNHLNGIHLVLGDTLDLTQKNNAEEALDRLAAIPALIDNVILALRTGIQLGITPAKVSVIHVPAQIDILTPANPAESYYFNCFKDLPTVKDRALTILETQVYPSLAKLRTFTVEEYLPACREDTSWKSLPNGKAWYQQCVKTHTTTELTPEEIHAIGLSEVARIRIAMRAIMEEVNFNGTQAEFFEFLRTDPSFFYTKRSDILEGYRNLIKTIEFHLPQLFATLPKLPCEVVPVPVHAEQSAPGAYYMPGSISGRPGKFYTNTYDLAGSPTWEMEALALHEALPGHHLQISLVLEQENLSLFRKTAFFTSYCEGWALYAEGLGQDLGLYRDPYARFGRLVYESVRAVRLVVDTGVHALGWSRQEAIDYMLENTSLSPNVAQSEIDRYITWPGQALAYKIGELKILELRHRAEKTLGEQFDIREFHDFILLSGMLPLSILEERFEGWLQSKVDSSAQLVLWGDAHL